MKDRVRPPNPVDDCSGAAFDPTAGIPHLHVKIFFVKG